MLAMGYGDVMPLSMLQHVQKNLDDYRNNGKKMKKPTGDDFEERLNGGESKFDAEFSWLSCCCRG